MRLLSTKRVRLVEVHDANTPNYAILSHTWSDEEILLRDVQTSDAYDSPWANFSRRSLKTFPVGGTKNKSLAKMLKSTALAAKEGFEHIWIDTCCIDKTSSAELSEAINSMYRWYAEASVCYAYLADVKPAGTEDLYDLSSSFRKSRWFTRGWTLQELIAPRHVHFFASDWSYLGSKHGFSGFCLLLSHITGVHHNVLAGRMSHQDVSIASRMHWAADRQTTRVEDVAYCLLGIFDVNMPLLYGEGKRSFIRLQEAILSKEDDQSLFAWHSEPRSDEEEEEEDTRRIDKPSRLTGLLADSPRLFWDDCEVEPATPFTLTSSPPTVSSKGLGVDLVLLPCEDDELKKEADYVVVLNCERLHEGERQSPVIYLKRVWGVGDQFARVRSDLRTFISPNVSVLEGGTEERVFVKQNPAADMRTIRVLTTNAPWKHLHLGHGRYQPATDWNLIDAWPIRGWDSQSRIFQTQNMSFGLPCGILRLHDMTARHWRTLDVAVGMHAPSPRLCRSWCQIMTCDSDSSLESVFSRATREALAGKIDYNEVSTRDIHGVDLSTRVVVTGRNRKKGVDINLDVLSEIPSEQWQQAAPDGYGEIIPLSTLSKGEMGDALKFFPPESPLRLDYSHSHTHTSEVAMLLEELTVVDSVDISLFPKTPFGSRVRIAAPGSEHVPLASLEGYFFIALPAGDDEARRAVEVLLGELGEGGNTGPHREATGFLEHEGTIDPSSKMPLERLERTRRNGDSPLHLAAADAIEESLWSKLRFEWLSVVETNRLGEIPLHRACAMGNMAAVYHLTSTKIRYGTQQDLKRGVNWLDNSGRTPLWHAACSDRTGQVTSHLLVCGADIDAADFEGRAPIHVACRQGSVGCLKQLEARGANLNLPAGALGLLPAHFAAIFGQKRCLDLLMRRGAKMLTDGRDGLFVNALHLAVANGRERCARAIWDALDPKPVFRGWSPCVVLEDSKAIFKWMHVEVNEEYWFAIEDPSGKGGTEDFVCLSAKGATPALWVDPQLSVIPEEDFDEEGDSEEEEDGEVVWYSMDEEY